MNKLLAQVLEAHGGVDRWREYAKVDATIVSGGGFFALKGFLSDPHRGAFHAEGRFVSFGSDCGPLDGALLPALSNKASTWRRIAT